MKKLSEQSLTNIALFYLRKYSATRKGLVQVLERKVRRIIREKGGELEHAKVLIDAVVARMVRDGYVDDARMAESKTASLHRQGKSSRVIELKLREKGIEPALAKKSAITTPEREFEAACTLVKRKRLGVDPERRQKDLAVLMRAGFGHELAKRALQSLPLAPVVSLSPEAPEGERVGVRGLPEEECKVLQFPPRAEKPVEPDPLEAACALVKKKRLGVDPDRRQKDLAVLMRAGFRFDVAKRALQ